MEEKTGIQSQTEPQYPLTKGLAFVACTVLAIVTSLIFPMGEFLLYLFVYGAGKEKKMRSRNQI